MWENETKKNAEMSETENDERSVNTALTQEKKSGNTEGIMLIQLLLCAGILVFVLITRALSSGLFAEIRNEYKGIMDKGADLSGQGELLRFANGFVDNIRQAASDILSQLEGAASQGGYQPMSGSAVPAGVSLADYAVSDNIYSPCNGTLTSHFGARINPVFKKADFHTGIDISAPFGSEVYSAFYGTIKSIDASPIRGNFVIIEHSPQLYTLYQHLSKVYVSEGDTVRKGDVIAAVGSTGVSTGAHLHFEIYACGKCVNPSKILVFDEL